MGDIVASGSSQPAKTDQRPVRQYRINKKPLSKRICEKPKQYLWDERTKLERALIILFTISVIVLAALSITVNILNKRDVTSYCVTKDCVNTGNYILNSVDRAKDPCNDFYKFACGKFLEESLAPEKSESTERRLSSGDNLYTRKQKIFYARIKNILDSRKESDPKALWKARRYYDSCMDTEKINSLDLQPMEDLLQLLGAWPMLNPSWEESDFVWNETLVQFAEKGLDSPLFMDLNVIPSENVLTLDKPKFSLFTSQNIHMKYKEDTALKDYYYFMVNTSVIFGANRSFAEVECHRVFEFEKAVAELSIKENSYSEQTRSIRALKTLIPAPFDWEKFLGRLLPFAINGQEKVTVVNNEYFKKVLKLIEETSKRVVSNYLMWQAVQRNLRYLGNKAKKVLEKYHHGQTIDDSQPRWLFCLSHVWKEMISPAAMYVRKYVSTAVKEKVNTIFNEIRKELIEIIDYHKDFDGKKDVLKRLEGMDHFVFPDELIDDEKIDEYYQDLNLNEEEYFHNVLSLKKFIKNVKLRQYINDKKDQQWRAIYYQLELDEEKTITDQNILDVSFTFLMGYNFEINRPEYVNYASLGPAIGTFLLSEIYHELIGNILKQKQQCEMAEIGNVRGTNTMTIKAEVAVAAVQLAYTAYRNWAYYNGGEKNLPGLKYNPFQMFWIVDATQFCGKYPEDSSFPMQSEFRVNKPYSSLPEFSKDFQCGKESKMFAKNKCDMW